MLDMIQTAAHFWVAFLSLTFAFALFCTFRWGMAAVFTFLVMVIAAMLYPALFILPFTTHWQSIIAGFFGYVAIGSIYSIVKWRLYMNAPEVTERLKAAYESFKDSSKRHWERDQEIHGSKSSIKSFTAIGDGKFAPDAPTETAKQEWPGVTPEDFKASTDNFLRVTEHKTRIIIWIIWWVPSLVWTLTHDLVEHIYNMLSKFYSRIASNKIDSILK